MLKGKGYITKNSLLRMKLSELKPGAVFGEISVLVKRPRATNIVAGEGNSCASIKLRTVPDSRPGIGMQDQGSVCKNPDP